MDYDLLLGCKCSFPLIPPLEIIIAEKINTAPTSPKKDKGSLNINKAVRAAKTGSKA